jgi:hypothetical protein
MYAPGALVDVVPGKIGRTHATFLDDDVRYADVDGRVFPVLLTSFKTSSSYAEDMQDADEYPPDWPWQFHLDLKAASQAVLASDSNPDGNWRPLGIYRVSDVQLTNFLSCRVGKLVEPLALE